MRPAGITRTAQYMADLLSPRYHEIAYVEKLRCDFKKKSYIKLAGLLQPRALTQIIDDVRRLEHLRLTKNLRMAPFASARRMSVIGASVVMQHAHYLLHIYADPELRRFLEAVVDQNVESVQHDDESIVINFLTCKEDTHGWHVDDPRYALIIIVTSPDRGEGGQLEYIPDWHEYLERDGIDCANDVGEGVRRARRMGLIRTDRLEAGDCYLLDAAKSLHRVTPLDGNTRRVAVNLAFDDRRYREFGSTASLLYAAS